MRPALGWTLRDWTVAYRSGRMSEASVIDFIDTFDKTDPAWISLASRASLEEEMRSLRERLEAAGGDYEKLPLYGVPVAVKDNIDAFGFPTTNACPAFSRVPSADAEVVRLLKEAGALIVGKTNLDQFATGLVGTRSPYGAVPNAFDEAYIGGGSSSGSASVVARGLVPIALGTDTAGSGRVPAALQNIVGLKPSRGRLSTRGVVPACRTLDCVSVFSLVSEDAWFVLDLLAKYDAEDPYARKSPRGRPPAVSPGRARIGVPAAPRFFGDDLAERAFEHAVRAAEGLGAEIVPTDMSAFHDLAELLYAQSWVAERALSVGELLKTPELLDPVVGPIIQRGTEFTAQDAYRAEYRRAELARAIDLVMAHLDALMVPTVPTIFKRDEIAQDPVRLNGVLGTYTNFTNLADLAGIAVPAPFRTDGLPFGVTFLCPAFEEERLQELAGAFHRCAGVPLGATSRPMPLGQPVSAARPLQGIGLVVVGAHMRSMPLNHELRELGAEFVCEARTAGEYRLFALRGTKPEKPGLCRTPGQKGPGIEVELWDVPHDSFGPLLEKVSSPLGLGSVQLEDGSWQKGFICEPYGIGDAVDISSFGGFRAYVASQKEARAMKHPET